MVTKDNYFRIIMNYVFLATGPTMVMISFYILYYYLKFRVFIDPLIWRLPVAFLCLGIISIVLTILACCGLATEYGMGSIIYFFMLIVLICLEISLGAYWVNIQPQYPTSSTSMFSNISYTVNYTGSPITIPYTGTFPPGPTAPPEPPGSTGPPGPPGPSGSTNHRFRNNFKVEGEWDATVVNSEEDYPTPRNSDEDMQPEVSRKRLLMTKSNSEWSVLQLEFKCCGINGAKDFIDTGNGIPEECCEERRINDTDFALCELKSYAQMGCLEVLTYRIYVDRLILGSISIIAGTVTLIVLVISFFLRYDDDVLEGEMVYANEYCPDGNCRKYSDQNAVHLNMLCPHQAQASPSSSSQSKKYPPCNCAPKLRQC